MTCRTAINRADDIEALAHEAGLLEQRGYHKAAREMRRRIDTKLGRPRSNIEEDMLSNSEHCGHFGPYVVQEPCGGQITIVFNHGTQKEAVSVDAAYVLCDHLLRAANSAKEAERKAAIVIRKPQDTDNEE